LNDARQILLRRTPVAMVIWGEMGYNSAGVGNNSEMLAF